MEMPPCDLAVSPSQPQAWLVRIPEIFEPITSDILASLTTQKSTRLGREFHSIKITSPSCVQTTETPKFVRWNLPLEHSWPCHPQKMEGFIEKATQTLARKFSARNPQAVFVGALHPTSPDRYYRSLASNLRGRLLQVLPKLPVTEVEEQEPERETLFCLVGKEGLFAGMQSPLKCNGFYPGGSKFIDQDAPEVISRAGAKLAEALHYLRLHRAIPPPGSHWIELGASPGGMTSELLARAQRVTAIDRAPLDQRLAGRAGLTAVLADVATFQPAPGTLYDAILNDMNGPPEESIAQVIRLARYLTPRGLVIFTLKLPRIENMSDACGLFRKTVKTARAAGLHLIAQTHLTYNRHEFTLFLERSGSFS